MSKSFLVIYLVLILIAFTGILSQNGAATAITWGSVAPLLAFGVYHVSTAFRN